MLQNNHFQVQASYGPWDLWEATTAQEIVTRNHQEFIEVQWWSLPGSKLYNCMEVPESPNPQECNLLFSDLDSNTWQTNKIPIWRFIRVASSSFRSINMLSHKFPANKKPSINTHIPLIPTTLMLPPSNETFDLAKLITRIKEDHLWRLWQLFIHRLQDGKPQIQHLCVGPLGPTPEVSYCCCLDSGGGVLLKLPRWHWKTTGSWKLFFFWNWLCWCNMFINSSLFIHASQTFQLLFLAVQLTPKSQFQNSSFTSNLKFENLNMIKMKIKISAYLMPRDNTCILATIKWYCQFPHMRIQHRTTSANAGGFEKNSGKSFILGITASRQVLKSCGFFKGYNGINRYFCKRTKARVCLEKYGIRNDFEMICTKVGILFWEVGMKNPTMRYQPPPIFIAWDERWDSPLLR